MSRENLPSGDRTVEPSYNDILVPTDDSDGSLVALDHAIKLAKAFDGKIHALSVDEGTSSSHRDQIRTDSEDVAEAATGEVAERVEASGLPVSVSVRSGSAQEAISNYASESDIDLIVMGTRGRTGIKGAIFGSVAEETVRESPVPVLTVRADAEAT